MSTPAVAAAGSDAGSLPAQLRLLLVSQGALGEDVVGHATTARSLWTSLRAVPGLSLAAVELPARSRLEQLASSRVPGLDRFDLDAIDVRWLAVEGRRGRRAIESALSGFAPEVVHVHSHAAALGAARFMARVPTIVAVDATVADWRAMGIWRDVRPYSRAMLAPALARERRLFARAAHVVAYSQWAADAVRSLVPAAPVEVLHPGVDIRAFTPATRSPRDRPKLLFVGSRFARKGGQDLLEAVGPELGVRFDLDVVTPERVAPRPGLSVHRLAPGDPRLIELFQQADLFCLPTHGDTMPWAMLEALACATPVLTTRVGANAEMCSQSLGTGLLVDVGDVAALRSAVTDLFADPDRLQGLGRRGRQLIEQRFDSARQGRRLAELAGAVRDRAAPSTPS